MVKETRLKWSPRSLHQHFTCAKFLLCVLLITLFVCLKLFSSGVIGPWEEQTTKLSGIASSSPSPNASGQTPFLVISQVTDREKCNLFEGEWVPHPSGPAYTNQSCLFIPDPQNCMLNGRPDTGYLFWRWKPKGCDLGLFDAERFLNAMRNKWWAFIGDSITQNHIMSLLCLLSQAERPMDVFHDEEWKSRRWYFSSYNLTLSLIWSPLLVKADIIEGLDGGLSDEIHLHLDVLDEEWSSQLKNFDYVIASGGKWFLKTAIYYENNQIVGCHYCPGKNLSELGYDYGYGKALNLVLRHIVSSDFKGTVLFRTSTPDHYENGDSSYGDSCRRTHPFKGGEVRLNEVDKVMRKVEMAAFKQAVVWARIKGVDLRLMDTTHLSLLRPDGHPGPYRYFQPFAKDKRAKVESDCLHWCMPGPIDHWSNLLMEISMNKAW